MLDYYQISIFMTPLSCYLVRPKPIIMQIVTIPLLLTNFVSTYKYLLKVLHSNVSTQQNDKLLILLISL